MDKIDRVHFFGEYRELYGPQVQRQVDGLSFLLDRLEADSKIQDIRWVAYMLATVKHECANKWQPIREFGRGKGKKYGETYYGRGFVQLTWEGNYAKMGRIFGVDLVANPDLVLDPDLAYKIMSYGMRHGSFTGVGLARFIHDDVCDYLNARKIINGLDEAERTAQYARNIERCLK